MKLTTGKTEIVAPHSRFHAVLSSMVGRLPSSFKSAVRLSASPWPRHTNRSASSFLFVASAADVDDSFIDHSKNYNALSKKFLFFNPSLSPDFISRVVITLGLRDWSRFYIVDWDVSAVPARVETILNRLVRGLISPGDYHSILDARFQGDTLVVVSPRFDKLQVPLSMLLKLKGATAENLLNFEIDNDGSYIYWPDIDVHLGWSQFEQLVSPDSALKSRQKSEIFNKQFGLAVRSFRKSSGLRQSDIEGLTPRQVGRIESGRCRATSAAIRKFAKSHRLVPDNYLSRVAGLLNIG